jgi:hypothetical protein
MVEAAAAAAIDDEWGRDPCVLLQRVYSDFGHMAFVFLDDCISHVREHKEGSKVSMLKE